MKLYLLRHGDAEVTSPQGDRGRVLTEEGLRQAKIAGRFLRDLHPDVVLISTYKRAKQTLEIIHRESCWNSLREFVSLDVAPDGSIDDLLIELKAYDEKSILIVGHNPQMAHLVYHLTKKDISVGNCTFIEIDMVAGKLVKSIDVEDM